MKIITRGEAMRIHQQHPTSRLFPFCTGKYAGTAALKRIPVVKCRIFPVCWPCLLNVVRTVLARMSG
ncbi:CP4-44 prophage [Escherichia coli]|uniref:CP4-44 prophage n=1 Tax=Escherichia coli TaxID=562 RepID=A0A376CQU0_ECOLX|nr:CP4-44 prophage [Escherichia coli]